MQLGIISHKTAKNMDPYQNIYDFDTSSTYCGNAEQTWSTNCNDEQFLCNSNDNTSAQYPQSICHDPEYCVMRQDFLAKPSLGSPPQRSEAAAPFVPFFQYHRLYPLHQIPECNELEPIPFTQNEYEFLCNEIPDPMWNSTFCLERILTLLCQIPSSPFANSADIAAASESILVLKTRIMELFKFYKQKSKAGIFLQDGNILKNIMLISIKLQDKLPFLVNIVEAILKQFGKGFRITNMKNLTYSEGLVDIFNDFGIIIRNRTYQPWLSDRVIVIVEQLLELYDDDVGVECKTIDPAHVDCSGDDKLLDKHMFNTCIEQSQLGPRLIQLVIETIDQFPLYSNVLALLTRLINSSDQIRTIALTFPILEPMILQLKHPDEHCKVLCRITEVIYSLLAKPIEHIYNEKDIAPISVQAFEVLLFRFLQRMRHITSKYLINLRNDVAFVIYLLAKHVPVLRQHFSRHAYVIAGIIANNVISQENIPFVLDSTAEDLELLEILLWILEYILESDAECEEIVTKYELVSVLVRIIIGPCTILDSFEEDNLALQEVVQCAWKVLAVIVKKLPMLVLDAEGLDAILKVLRIYSVFGQLDSGVVAILLDLTRILLRHDEKQDEIIPYFVNKEATIIITGVLSQLVKKELSISEEPTLCNCLVCCAILTGYDQNQRDIFLQEHGVKTLTLLMYKLIYKPAHNRHMNPMLHICVAECVWKSLTDSLASLEIFVAYEGIFRMLDMLEISAGPAAQIHLLSCLVELCEYSRCVGQLLYWKRRNKNKTKRHSHSEDYIIPQSRGPRNVKPMPGDVFGDVILDHDLTLSALLCDLWRNEEDRFGCARDKKGIIASLDNPLMSQFSKEYQQNRQIIIGQSNGPSCLDLIISIRPKIYLLVKKIIETTNTEATVFGSLSLPNQVTMQIIINFLDLKRGEIWLEMIDELKSEEVNLVESDQIALKRFLKISRNKVCAVIDTQRYLIHRAKEHDEMHERELYNVLQQCHFQNHLLALKEADFYARTSNYFLLIDKRLWQKTQLQQAVRSVNSNARIHRTTDDTLNITIWPGRHKMVTSEPLHAFDEDYGHESPIRRSSLFGNVESTTNFEAFGTGTGPDSLLDGRLNPTRARSEGFSTMPGSTEEGFFEISALTLQKALLMVSLEQRKWNWSDLEDDRAWRMRTKWKNEWYP